MSVAATFQPRAKVHYAGSRQCSPLLERLNPAKQAGFDAISVWPGDVRGQDRAMVAKAIAAAGLFVSEVELVTNWMPQHATASSAFGEFLSTMTADRVFPIAAELGASTVSAAELFGLDVPASVTATHFGALCDQAAQHGLRVALEFVPTGGVPDLACALNVLDRAGRPNGGLMIDAWHFFRSNSSIDVLAKVPGDLIYSVQLNDARATPEQDLAAGMMNRLLPGDGELDLKSFMQAIAATGTNAYVGVETFSKPLDSMTTEQAAQRCADALNICLSHAVRP